MRNGGFVSCSQLLRKEDILVVGIIGFTAIEPVGDDLQWLFGGIVPS